MVQVAPLIDHPFLPMPAIGFGTFELDGETVLRILPEALEIGYRHIDTAQAYGNEAEIGRALESSGVDRSEVFLTTKVWVDRFEPGELRASVAESLDRLRSDHVDLLLLHWPVFGPAGMGPTLEALVREQEDGRVRHIGVSNFTVLGPIPCGSGEFAATIEVIEPARRRGHSRRREVAPPTAPGQGFNEPVPMAFAAGYRL